MATENKAGTGYYPPDLYPAGYDDWRECIEKGCKIELTGKYLQDRLAALNDKSDRHTARFLELYGEEHRIRVCGWFQQALKSDYP